ncbi:hypothetical protein E2C01_095520 [Portunus trituberculatus]|uniref:Uncharacterized protein n=1 Tax=Portunus trituberculatus TaxID=210409 RepID=A0A5B7JQ16_PORTR|nr:hypothetical protein [Portunus trituberculatus]
MHYSTGRRNTRQHNTNTVPAGSKVANSGPSITTTTITAPGPVHLILPSSLSLLPPPSSSPLFHLSIGLGVGTLDLASDSNGTALSLLLLALLLSSCYAVLCCVMLLCCV